MSRTFTTAALLLGLVSLAQLSHATTQARKPANPSLPTDAPKTKQEICKLEPGKCAYMPQADAFETAGEQALFLAVYQRSFGPYGLDKNPKERNQLLKETAAAINDCLAGANCGAKKQELVLRALIQYNMGQDIKRMMLTNNSNKVRMQSIEDYSKDARGKIKLDPAAIDASLAQGKTFTYENGKGNLARANRGESSQSRLSQRSTISRRASTAKDPYFSMKEDEIKSSVHPDDLKNLELFGERYLKDYSAVLDRYSKPDESNQYKYVPVKETYVYSEAEGKTALDPAARFEEVKQEQERIIAGKALENFKQTLAPVSVRTLSDGRVGVDTAGFRQEVTGLGVAQDVDQARYADKLKIQFDDINNNTTLDPTTRNARAITRVVNAQIKSAVDERLAKDKATAAKAGRATASVQRDGRPAPIANTKVNVVLNPADFDKFLNEIWPSSAARQARIQAP